MKCPGCGNTGPFRIYGAVCEAHVGSDDSVEASYIEWCEDDTCTCDLCGHTAEASAFEEQ